MIRGAVKDGFFVPSGKRAVDDRQDPAHGAVKRFDRKTSGPDGGDDELVGMPSGGGHLQFAARRDSRDMVVDRAPVGHDEAVEAPVVAQPSGQRGRVFRTVHAVRLIIGRHHGPGAALLYGAFEIRPVYLAERPFVDHGVDRHAAGFLIVGGEMLERGADVLRLDPVDPGGGDFPGNDRIFGKILEIPAAERRALDICPRAEEDLDVFGLGFVPQRRSHPENEVAVEGAGQARSRREADGDFAVMDREVFTPGKVLPAQSMRPVGEHDRRDSQPFDRFGMPVG